MSCKIRYIYEQDMVFSSQPCKYMCIYSYNRQFNPYEFINKVKIVKNENNYSIENNQ